MTRSTPGLDLTWCCNVCCKPIIALAAITRCWVAAHPRTPHGGARARNRTVNLGIKSPLLCQLSYAGGFCLISETEIFLRTQPPLDHGTAVGFQEMGRRPEFNDEAESAHSIPRVYRAKCRSAPNPHCTQPKARFGWCAVNPDPSTQFGPRRVVSKQNRPGRRGE